MKRRTPGARAVDPVTAKRRWVIAQYEALLPEAQRAVDMCFKALPRRPVSASERQALLKR